MLAEAQESSLLRRMFKLKEVGKQSVPKATAIFERRMAILTMIQLFNTDVPKRELILLTSGSSVAGALFCVPTSSR
jgi:hypothetical protein